MAAPVPELYVPTHLYPTSAFFHGMCRSMGGLPTKFWFSYRNPFWWKITPWREVDHDGQLFDENVTGIGWDLIPLPFGIKMSWRCQVIAWAKNADGVVNTKPITFWLPRPTKPDLGAPWLIVRAGGSFSDMVYDWSAESDIGCLLHLLVGTRKPYISPTVHVTKGVVFHHDAELWFTWKWRINSEQTIDTLLHDFHIPFLLYGKTYWFVAMGSVDGKNSPSISPPFSFRMLHPPKMETDDPFDITTHSAKLPGHLVDDYGMPAFVRFNYGKMPNYTENTPTLGPEAAPFDYTQEIDGLQPDTWYRTRAEGSHDEGFPTHGISYPKDFKTLAPPPPVEKEKCLVDSGSHWWIKPDYWIGIVFQAPANQEITNILLKMFRYYHPDAPYYWNTAYIQEAPDWTPTGAVLATADFHTSDLPLNPPGAWYSHALATNQIQAGHRYAVICKTNQGRFIESLAHWRISPLNSGNVPMKRIYSRNRGASWTVDGPGRLTLNIKGFYL